jgi:hypothetical protein
MEKFSAPLAAITDPHAYVDALVERARALRGFMSDAQAIEVLMESGVGGEAYLAVTAAKLLDKDPA